MSSEQSSDTHGDQGRMSTPAHVGSLWTDGLGTVAMRCLQFLIILAAVAVAVLGLSQVSIVVIPLLLALIVASAAAPVLRWFERRHWPRAASTALVLIAVLVLFAGLVWLVVLQVEHEWDELAENVSSGISQLLGWWNATFPQIPLDGQGIEQLWSTIRDWASNLNYGAVGTGVASGLSAFGSIATSAVLFAVILFFFMKDGPRIWQFLIAPLTGAKHRRAELMGTRSVHVMGGYVRGTVIVALVDAIFIGLGLVILQVPLALPLALIVFVTAFIPVVGATLAGIVAALVTLVTNGLVPAIVVVAIVVVVNQLEGNFLQPVVLGRSLKLHELVVLLALTTGTVLGGIIGAIMAVPLAAVGWALVKAWNEPLPELEADSTGNTMLQRLREQQALRRSPKRRVTEEDV